MDEGKYFDINALPDDTKAVIWKNEKKITLTSFIGCIMTIISLSWLVFLFQSLLIFSLHLSISTLLTQQEYIK